MSSGRADRDGREYAVYAIKYAHREKSVRQEHFYRAHTEPCDTAMPITYYVWLVVGRGRVILVDTGFTPEVAARRGDRDYVQTPMASIEALGIAPAEVDTVVVTHLHYDHAGFIDAFPKATVVLQQRELDFWTGRHATRGEYPHLIEDADFAAVRAAEAEGRLTLVDGDARVADDVEVHLTGGHTAGMQVVALESGGTPVVLASDASHFLDNIGQDRPYSIVDHLPSMYDAFDWITERAGANGIVIPGHDPAVMERFPAVPGLEGIVVRIA